MLILHSVNSDRLFNTQSRVLQLIGLYLKLYEKATLNIGMPYWESGLSIAADISQLCVYNTSIGTHV